MPRREDGPDEGQPHLQDPRPGRLHGPRPPSSRTGSCASKASVPGSAVIVLRSLMIFWSGALRFYFALSCADYVAGPSRPILSLAPERAQLKWEGPPAGLRTGEARDSP